MKIKIAIVALCLCALPLFAKPKASKVSAPPRWAMNGLFFTTEEATYLIEKNAPKEKGYFFSGKGKSEVSAICNGAENLGASISMAIASAVTEIESLEEMSMIENFVDVSDKAVIVDTYNDGEYFYALIFISEADFKSLSSDKDARRVQRESRINGDNISEVVTYTWGEF